MKTLGLENIKNNEVSIYVETAKEIFDRCFQEAGIESKAQFSQLLAMELNREFLNNPVTAEYIKNKFNIVLATIKKDIPYQKITFLDGYLNTLCKYAGIDDYRLIDNKYKPFAISALFTDKPYSLLNFLRVVEYGHLKRHEKEWEYRKEDGRSIYGKVYGLELYTMKGDTEPRWIKVNTNKENKKEVVFFANGPETDSKVQSTSSRLFLFFNRLLD